jgi:hypothetical protein
VSSTVALKAALDLLHVPSQVRVFRSEPLPDGVPILLRIAAGDDEASEEAALSLDRSREIISSAAAFYIEQILFASNADSYRVLGATPQASAHELRHNVALLMRWLHPDLDPRGERACFVSKVTAAWNNLKTPERRAAYDELCRRSEHRRSKRKVHGSAGKRAAQFAAGVRQGPRPRPLGSGQGGAKTGFLRRALSLLLHRPMQ